MKRLSFYMVNILGVCMVNIPAAMADVTLKQDVTVSASGAMSMMGSRGTITTIISGDRGRTENQMESTSKLMKKFAKNLNTATIMLLDEELMLNLVTEKQQYSEVTFDQMRAQLEKGMEQAEQVQGQGALPVNEEECQWSEPIMDVKKTGEKQKFANIKAQQTIISVTQTCSVPESEKSCNMTWNMEYWNAKRMPGKKEAIAFQQGMAKAMGGEEALGLAQAHSRGLMAMFKKGWDELLQESGDLEGYPVKTVMSFEMGGENCTTATGQPIAMDDVWSEAADAAMDAAAQSAAGHAGNVVANETAEAVGGGIGGSVAGSAIGAASKKLMSGAFKKFGKKKKKPEPVVEEANPAAASVTLFKISTELTGVDENDVPDSLFTAPDGWEKVPTASW